MTFEMWSSFHYLFLASPFIFTLILYFLTRRLPKGVNRFIGLVLAIICIALLALRNYEIFQNRGMHPEIIPAQICHLANFFLLFAFLFNNRTMFTVAFCFNLPFAMFSIIFADGLENYTNILTYQGIAYIAGHALIVGITLWSLLVGFVRIDKRPLFRGAFLVMTMFIASIPLNYYVMDKFPGSIANYFYSTSPERGTPLEMAYNWGENVSVLGYDVNLIYVGVLAAVGLLLYFSLAGIAHLATRKKFKNDYLY